MSNPDPCGCSDALARLWAYLDSELEELDAAQVQAHLDDCEGCLSEYEVELVIKRVLRRGCAEHAPETLRLRIWQQITQQG
ncbi:MAG: mycothiol system anti-sigma-R factor [Micrococcales bacterium]|nr:mycothiol system anti-sigma-R factor [Micrococcales bacterium]MCL2666899.1 mycothiol system anti-sigma-R factor [Micrococcales bacterium]